MCQRRIPLPITRLILILSLIIAGCDDRVTQVAREAADRQAQQNTAMAELNKEVASGTHQLVEADADTRNKILSVHRDLQAERTRLDTSWSDLEKDRKEIASQRRTESTLVAMTPIVSALLAGVALLGFCWLVLVGARREVNGELTELVVEQLLLHGEGEAGLPPLLSRLPTDESSEGP